MKQVGNLFRIPPICFDRHRFQRALHLPSPRQHDIKPSLGQPSLGQPRMQPLRQLAFDDARGNGPCATQARYSIS